MEAASTLLSFRPASNFRRMLPWMRTPPHAVGWRLLEKAFDKKPHAPIATRSLQSRGPIRAFGCDLCGDIFYLYHSSDSTPFCRGGFHSRTRPHEEAEGILPDPGWKT